VLCAVTNGRGGMAKWKTGWMNEWMAEKYMRLSDCRIKLGMLFQMPRLDVLLFCG